MEVILNVAAQTKSFLFWCERGKACKSSSIRDNVVHCHGSFRREYCRRRVARHFSKINPSARRRTQSQCTLESESCSDIAAFLSRNFPVQGRSGSKTPCQCVDYQ